MLYKYGHKKLILVYDILFSGVITPANTAGIVIMKYLGEVTKFLIFPITHAECDGS
jgi:hypothetical protein